MSLADKVNQPPPRRPSGHPCSVAEVLQQVEGDERDALITILNDRNWTTPMVYEALIEEGHQVGFQTIGRHRNRQCRCAK